MINSALIFLASISGIYAYYSPLSASIFIGFFILFVVGIGVTAAARMMTKEFPVEAVWMFQAWRIVPLTFIFLGAFASVWLSVHIPTMMPPTFSPNPGQGQAEKEAFKALTTTAFTALLAAVVLDAARDPKSSFWPDEQYKRSLKAAYHTSPVFKLLGGPISRELRHAIEDLAAAYIEPTTEDNEATGWAFKDRLHRAKVIRASLKIFRKNGVGY